jgi:hypothetical protein
VKVVTIRAGQKAFNDLYANDPALADAIRGTEADPFYDDSRLTIFWDRVDEILAARSDC